MSLTELSLTCFLASSFGGYLATIRYETTWGFGDDVVFDLFFVAWPLLVVLDILLLTGVL